MNRFLAYSFSLRPVNQPTICKATTDRLGVEFRVPTGQLDTPDSAAGEKNQGPASQEAASRAPVGTDPAMAGIGLVTGDHLGKAEGTIPR